MNPTPTPRRTHLQSVGANDQQRSHLVSGTLQLHIAVLLQEAFRESELSKSQLASRMDLSRARVGQILDGEPHNFTLDLIGRAAGAMGCSWHVSLRDFWTHDEKYTIDMSPIDPVHRDASSYTGNASCITRESYRFESSQVGVPMTVSPGDGKGLLVRLPFSNAIDKKLRAS